MSYQPGERVTATLTTSQLTGHIVRQLTVPDEVDEEIETMYEITVHVFESELRHEPLRASR